MVIKRKFPPKPARAYSNCCIKRWVMKRFTRKKKQVEDEEPILMNDAAFHVGTENAAKQNSDHDGHDQPTCNSCNLCYYCMRLCFYDTWNNFDAWVNTLEAPCGLELTCGLGQ